MLFCQHPAVELALGGSILAEELKGDPGRAAALASDSLVDRGLALVQQGLPGAAQPVLLKAIEHGAPESALLAGCYERLATYARFNAFPDGQGAASEEVNARWDGVAYETAAAARLDALAARVPGSQVLAVRQPTELITSVGSIRSSLELMRFVPNPPAGALDNLLPAALRVVEPPAWAAFARFAAADLCRRAGEQARAEAFLDEALAAYRALDDAAGEALCELARADWRAAPFSSPVSLNLALRESPSEGSDLDWRLEAAEFGSAGMDLDAARAGYARAQSAFAAAGAERGLASVALRHGYLALVTDDFDAAAAYAGAARERFTAAGDVAGAQLAATHEALARIGAGALAEDRAVAAAVGHWGASPGSFSFALGLGLLCGRAGRHWALRRGDVERALACHRLAGALYGPLGAQLNLAQSFVDQALVLAGVGDSAGAGAAYEVALEHNSQVAGGSGAKAEVGRRRSLLLATQLLGDQHARQDADGMERACARALAELERLPADAEPQEQAIAGLTGWLLGQMGSAIPLARAMALKRAGDSEAARPWFEAALTATEQASADVRHLLEAAVLGSQERFSEAREAYRKHTAQRDAGGSDSDKLVAMLGPEQADRQQRNRLEHDFAFLTRIRAWDEAQTAAEALVMHAGPEWWAQEARPWSVLSDLGQVLEGRERFAAALERYEQAMDTFEARREKLGREGLRTVFAGSRDAQWLYFLAARCALKLAGAEPSQAPAARAAAFRHAERGKARALLDLMARSAARAAVRPGETATRRRWRELGAQVDSTAQLLALRRGDGAPDAELTWLEQQLTSEQEAMHALETQLTHDDPGWLGGVRTTGEVAKLDAVAAALPPGTAMLQWLFLGRDLIAWAITGAGMAATHHRELDAEVLGREIRELRAACEDRSPGWEAGAQRLADTLLAPFAGVLATHERVIGVPYGVAHELPLHALTWQGQPLCVSHTVSTLPSASVLRYAGDRPPRPWRVLAVGNPVRMAYRAPGAAAAEPAEPLRGAEAEAVVAAGSFPGGEALLGEAATEEAVRARIGDFPVLHFATHGRLDQDAPGLSCVLLADGEALSVQELAGLDLDVDLAVLSACRTGQGEATRGDDVVGLARGLLGAGCRAAVVSLWPVDDASTTLLMAAFYAALKAGAPPADALRGAQCELRGLDAAAAAARLGDLRAAVPPGARDMVGRLVPAAAAGYGHPYHWAPFALVGVGTTGGEHP